MEDNNYLREVLEQRGWYKRWYTQVMADILMPHVSQMAEPEKNAVLNRFKEEENNMLALYMVKEFLKNVGLSSTGKIFETEAGLAGMEQEFQPIIADQFSLLKPSTADEIQPPLLSQALHIWKVEAERHAHAAGGAAAISGDQSVEMNSFNSTQGMKTPAIINRLMRSDSCLLNSADGTAYETALMDSGNADSTAAASYRLYQNPQNHSHNGTGNADPLSGGGAAGMNCRRNHHRSMNCKRCG